MAHAREQIRDAFYNALLDNTAAGSNVFQGGWSTAYDLILPALYVFTRNEEVDTERGRSDRMQYRTLTVSVQMQAKSETLIDGTMDDLSAQVETLVFFDPGVQALIHCIDLVTTELEVSKEGEQEIGMNTLNFDVDYMTEKGKPEVVVL